MKRVLHLHLRLERSHFIPQIQQVPGYDYMHLIRKPKYVIDKNMNTKEVALLDGIKSEKKFAKKYEIKILHAHHADMGLLLLPFQAKTNLPLVTSIRGRDATFANQPANYHEQLKKLFAAGDRFFPVCEFLAERFVELGCPQDKVRVLYGGVDLGKFAYESRNPSDSQHILSVGRLVEKKGHHILMQAFAKIRDKFPRATLTIIGTGKMLNKLNELAAQLNLSDSFSLLNAVHYDRVAEKMSQADIFCAASLTASNGDLEGIPNTLKEAMATGMPVISTYHAGIPELIKDGHDGVLVKENNVDDLADALEYMLEHPKKWEKFGKNARRKVEKKFNLEKQLQKQAEYYDEIGG